MAPFQRAREKNAYTYVRSHRSNYSSSNQNQTQVAISLPSVRHQDDLTKMTATRYLQTGSLDKESRGSRAVVFGLKGDLNGAVVYIESSAEDITASPLVTVRVTHPPETRELYPGTTQVQLSSLRPCSTDELGHLYENVLPELLWRDVRVAVRELQRVERLSWRDKRRLSRECALVIWTCARQCCEALGWLDVAAEVYCESTLDSAPEATAAVLYAFLHACCCAAIGFACSVRGDGPGELAAYCAALQYSLGRRGLAALAAHFGRPALVGELALRAAEALRAVGQTRSALAPAAEALAEAVRLGDPAAEARAQGTVAMLHITLGDLAAAASAAKREVELLRTLEQAGSGSLRLARALGCLAAITCGLAEQAGPQAGPAERRDVAAAAADAAALLEEAFTEVRQNNASQPTDPSLMEDLMPGERRSDKSVENDRLRGAWTDVSACLRSAMERLTALRAHLRAAVIQQPSLRERSGSGVSRDSAAPRPRPDAALIPTRDGTAPYSRLLRPSIAGSLLPPLLPGAALEAAVRVVPRVILASSMRRASGEVEPAPLSEGAWSQRESRPDSAGTQAAAYKRVMRTEKGTPSALFWRTARRAFDVFSGKHLVHTYFVDGRVRARVRARVPPFAPSSPALAHSRRSHSRARTG